MRLTCPHCGKLIRGMILTFFELKQIPKNIDDEIFGICYNCKKSITYDTGIKKLTGN